MAELIINGIFTLSGTVIGALFSFFAARDSKGGWRAKMKESATWKGKQASRKP